MKKSTLTGIFLILVLGFFPFCTKKSAAPETGSAKLEDMLKLIPMDVQAVFAVDLHKAMSTEFVDKSLKEEKNYEEYQKFIKETGIDPKQDIFFLVAALTKGVSGEKQKGVVLLNMKYDKDLILNKIREDKGGITEEDYNGITIYKVEEEKDDNTGAFLDSSNVVFGSEKEVKAVIDVFQKKGENVFKNPELAALIDQSNKSALFWGAIIIPPDTMKQAATQNPMLSSLESVKSATIFFDYQNKTLEAEIKIMSPDEAQNQKVVELLNGFKAMGSMAAAKDPNVGELLEKIKISSAPDHVKIYAKIPESLIDKLQKEKKKEETGEQD